MGSASYHKAVCLAALVSLIHCGYSAAQHRSYLRLTGDPFESLPVDIVVQTLVSLLVLCYCAGGVAGELDPLRTEGGSRYRSWDSLGACTSFAAFHHRAKALSPYFAQAPKYRPSRRRHTPPPPHEFLPQTEE